MATTNTFVKCEIRSIDAWRFEGAWEWNESFVLESDVYFREDCVTPRRITAYLRKLDLLSESSKGRVRVVNEWPIIEIQDKSTGQPVFALLFEE